MINSAKIEPDSLLSPVKTDEEKALEGSLRPQRFSEFVGQDSIQAVASLNKSHTLVRTFYTRFSSLPLSANSDGRPQHRQIHSLIHVKLIKIFRMTGISPRDFWIIGTRCRHSSIQSRLVLRRPHNCNQNPQSPQILQHAAATV